MEQKDYYEILELTADADHKQIRDAYRKLALQYHPDRNQDNPEAAEHMKAINEAYAVLSDPQKRKEYDAFKQNYGSSAYGRYRQTHSEQDIFRGSDIQQIFEELSRAFGYRGFDDIFREFYGSGYRSFEFRQPGVFGRVFVGGFGAGPSTASGAGQLPGQQPLLAGALGKLIKYGLKKKWGIELPERGKDIEDSLSLSADIARTGGKVPYSCKKTGKTLSVTIPPNVKEGQKLRLKGMGEPGQGGAEAGDLYVALRIRNLLGQKTKNFFDTLRSIIKPR